MSEKLCVVMALCLLVLTAGALYKAVTLGGDEADYEVICLGGHEYWRASFTVLAVKLNNDGTPATCERH